LLHAPRSRSDNRQLVQRVIRKLRVSALRKIQNIRALRIQSNQRAHYRRNMFKIAVALIQIRQLKSDLGAQLEVSNVRECLVQRLLRRAVSQSLLAHSQQRLGTRERWLGRHCLTQVLRRTLTIVPEEFN